jgi:hypothetical protein
MGLNFGAALAEQEESEEEGAEVEVLRINGYSLEAVKPSIMQIVGQIDKMTTDAQALVVNDDQSASFAVSLGGAGKKISKGIEARRKEIVADPNEFIKSVNGFCKIFTDKLDGLEKTLKKKIGDYQYQIELERREQERKQKEAAEALQKRLQAEADEANRKAREEAARKAEAEMKVKREREEAEASERGAKEAELKALAAKAEAERLEALRIAEANARKIEVEAPTVIAPVVQEEKRTVRSETGSSSYQAKRWKGDIYNPTLVPAAYCTPDQKKIDEAIKAGVRGIPGVRIFEDVEVRFRA